MKYTIGEYGQREYVLQVKDLMGVILDYDTDCDIVQNKVKIYKIKRGERYGRKYEEICEMKVKYLTAVDYRTVEIGVE
jgi:hypothetical protein